MNVRIVELGQESMTAKMTVTKKVLSRRPQRHGTKEGYYNANLSLYT